jgi:hypothetical protein
MVWWPFATPLERADTLEATDLLNYAPPLYSTDRLLRLKRTIHEITRTNTNEAPWHTRVLKQSLQLGVKGARTRFNRFPVLAMRVSLAFIPEICKCVDA